MDPSEILLLAGIFPQDTPDIPFPIIQHNVSIPGLPIYTPMKSPVRSLYATPTPVLIPEFKMTWRGLSLIAGMGVTDVSITRGGSKKQMGITSDIHRLHIASAVDNPPASALKAPLKQSIISSCLPSGKFSASRKNSWFQEALNTLIFPAST